MNVDVLEKAIRESWCKETYGERPEDFNPENPAYGQCSLTALVVNDYFGGKIISVIAKFPGDNGIAFLHYVNRVGDNKIDIAGCQFPIGTSYEPTFVNGLPASRENLLSNKSRKRRYELLKQKVDEKLDSLV